MRAPDPSSFLFSLSPPRPALRRCAPARALLAAGALALLAPLSLAQPHHATTPAQPSPASTAGAADPHAPAALLSAPGLPPAGGATAGDSIPWRQANEAVAAFPRGHADIVAWEAAQGDHATPASHTSPTAPSSPTSQGPAPATHHPSHPSHPHRVHPARHPGHGGQP